MALSKGKCDPDLCDDLICDIRADTALMHAQADIARAGATRAGYLSPKVFVSVAGVQRAWAKAVSTDKLEDFSIHESTAAAPNRASFTAKGWEPTIGMAIIATLGSKNRLKRIFGGTLLTVREANTGTPDNRDLSATAVDWTWSLNRVKVLGHFTGTGDAIALELMSTYAPTDFTVRNVEADLPTIEGGITFTNVDLSVALGLLAKRIPGCRQYIDYRKDLYFRVTAPAHLTNPTTLRRSLSTLKRFTLERDLSPVFTRVSMEGGGANAATETAAGETILPLIDAPDTWYGDVGGVVLSGPQQISYTARVAGGGGSLVGPGAAPSSAPTLALANGTGVTSGAHDVAVVFKTGAGTSLPGPTSSLTVGYTAAPSIAPTPGSTAAGSGMTTGEHRFALTHVTPSGETDPSPTSSPITVGPVTTQAANPTTAPTIANNGGASGGWGIGTNYYFRYAYSCDAANLLGNMTAMSPVSSVLVSDGSKIDIQLPYSTNPGVTKIVMFFEHYPNNATFRTYPSSSVLVVNNNSGGGTFSASLDASGLSGPQDVSSSISNTSSITTNYNLVNLSGLEAAPATATGRNLYATEAGGSQLKFVALLDTTSTTYQVSTADGALGSNVPTSNTATANQIGVSGIAIGPSGTTERELYMSLAGGGARKLALTIANNTATTGTITISDASLSAAAAEPVTDTSGLSQPTGVVLPGSSTLLVAGLAPFLAAGGWAQAGTQFIRYTSFTGSSLAGIPASGAGAIQQALAYNTVVAAVPCLIGVPASGDGAILYTIPKGQAVNCFVTVEDEAAAFALAELLDDGSDGFRVTTLQDRRLSRAEAQARAQAYLSIRGYAQPTAHYLTKDMNTTRGAILATALPSPTNVTEDFTIQAVTIDHFTANIPPDYTVQASTEFFSIEDLLARDPT